MSNIQDDINNLKAALKPYLKKNARVSNFIDELDFLAQQADFKVALAKAESLRDKLHLEGKQTDAVALGRQYKDVIHNILMLLATYWPTNEAEEEDGVTYFVDPVSEELLKPALLPIAVSAGKIYQKATLDNYFQKNTCYFELVGPVEAQRRVFYGPAKEVLTSRDLRDLASKGVIITERPDVDAELDVPVDDEFSFSEYLKDWYHVAVHRDADFLARLGRVFSPKTDAQWGFLVFSFLGAASGIGAIWPVILTTTLSLGIPGIIALSAVATLSAVVVAARGCYESIDLRDAAAAGDDRIAGRVFLGLVSAVATATVGVIGVGLMTLAAPYIVGALASASIISAGTASAMTAALPLLQIIVPSVLGFFGLVAEVDSPGGLARFFNKTLLSFATVPGAALGFLVGGTAGALAYIFSAGSNPPPAPPQGNAVPDAHDNNPDNAFANQASNNNSPAINPVFVNANQAAIVNALGGLQDFERKDEPDFIDPITAQEEAELKAVLGEEGYRQAMEASGQARPAANRLPPVDENGAGQGAVPAGIPAPLRQASVASSVSSEDSGHNHENNAASHSESKESGNNAPASEADDSLGLEYLFDQEAQERATDLRGMSYGGM